MLQPHRFWVDFDDGGTLIALAASLLAYKLILVFDEGRVPKNADFLVIVIEFIDHGEVLWQFDIAF